MSRTFCGWLRLVSVTRRSTALHLAVGTVKNHVSNVLIKLGVRDRTQAVLRAFELGLMETE